MNGMKKLLVMVFCFCFCCPWGGKAQDELYRMELGGGLGGAFYIGDANSKPFANLGPMGSIVARYIFNPRMAIKGNLAVGHISGDTGADFFPQDAGSGDAAGGTEEEKAQARQEAIRQYQQEQMNKMRNRDTAKRTSQRTDNEVHQPSLFDTL